MKALRSVSLFSLCMLLVGSVLPINVFAAEDDVVVINEANFPDENFRTIVSNLAGGNDGEFTPQEIASIRKIYCNSRDIESLEGIGLFTSLQDLTVNSSKMKTLDLSDNTMLKTLDCTGNQLEEINLSGNPYLTSLWCEENNLKSLDVSNNKNLQTLYCHTNQLTTLDVSNKRSLKKLDCSNNQLTTLDVTGDSALANLWTHNNKLAQLDVDSNTALSVLWCYGNPLHTIDVHANTKLTTLDCNDTGLQTLNIENNKSLNYLRVQNNDLTSLDVTNQPALKGLICYGNDLPTLDLSKNASLTELQCQENQLSQLDLSANTKLEKVNVSDNQLKTLDMNDKTALKELKCSDNQLTTVEIENDKKLKTFLGNDNELSSLNVNTNTSLVELNVSNNEITDLDLSKNTQLNTLDCSANQIVALDLSANKNLKHLTCENNARFISDGTAVSELPSFDVSKVVAVNGGNFENDAVHFNDHQMTYTYDSGNGNMTEFTLVNAAIEGLKPVKMSATLNDKIGMNVYLEVSNAVLKDPQAYVEFKVEDGSQVISKKVFVKDFKKDKGLYKVTMPLFARQMSDVVTMDVFTTNELGTVSKDASYTYSIVDYATKVLETSSKQEEIDIVEAMLNYGATAQQFFDYNTDVLANANIENKAYEAITAQDLEAYGVEHSGEIEGINYYGSNLRLLSDTAIRHHFVVSNDVEALYKDGTIKFVLVDDRDEIAITPTFYGGNKAYVEVQNIFAENLNEAYTIKVIDTRTEEELSVTYSVFSYVKDVLNRSDDQKLMNVAKAMVVYNQTAQAYQATL